MHYQVDMITHGKTFVTPVGGTGKTRWQHGIRMFYLSDQADRESPMARLSTYAQNKIKN